MKKEIETTIKKTEYYCDICGTPRYRACNDCGRDRCKDHTIRVDPDTGDYADYYCKDCYAIRERYQCRTDKLESQINAIYDEEEKELEEFRDNLKRK